MTIFSRKKDTTIFTPERLQARVSTVLGPGIHWIGDLHGTGGVRIEGTMQGDIVIKGLVVIGETGKLICPELKAETVVVAGTVQGNITCQKLEIRSTGRVWGDVVAVNFSSEDGAFLRGQMRMEEKIEIQLEEERPFDEFEMPEAKPEIQEEILPEPALPEASQAIAEDEPQEPAVEQQVSEAKTPEKPKLKSPWDN
jgi:cytoskeletal protein CcmA (bactofilin family)